MKKAAIYCLQLLTIVGIASLTSCGKSDPVTPTGNPTISVAVDPTAGYKLQAGQTRYKFEKGDKFKVKLTSSIPGGVQIFQVWRKVGTPASATDFGTDVSSSYTAQAPAAGATSINKTYEINVTENFDAVTASNNIVTFTFRVRNSQMTAGTFINTKIEYEVTTQGQGGGGGTAILLRANANVTLGAQGSALPSYASSQSLSTGSTAGLYSTVQAGALNSAQKQAVDLTFGVAGADNNAAVGALATKPQLISPDERAGKGFNNPLGVDAKTTTFKATTLTEANLVGATSIVTATTVNNIDHSTGAVKFIDLTQGTVYSFVNAQGAKGYVLIKTLTGTQDARDANITVLVQQLQ